VFVSYSTDPLQNRPVSVQTALDGLEDLSVRVIATTSGAFGVDDLSVPANAVVVDYIPHNQVMPNAAVVVGHAGHGTTISALCHGVPLVCVPGLGRDQVPIATRAAELGLGIALIDRATSQDIRTAVTAILGDGSYRDRVRQFKSRCDNVEGATTAAAMLEAMLKS
jgi:MGT family glycosyltransferase